MLVLKDLIFQYWPICQSILENLPASDVSMILAIVGYRLNDSLREVYLNPLRDIYQNTRNIQQTINNSHFFLLIGPDIPLLIQRITTPIEYNINFNHKRKLNVFILIVPKLLTNEDYSSVSYSTCFCPDTFMPGEWYNIDTTLESNICSICNGSSTIDFPSKMINPFNSIIEVRAGILSDSKQLYRKLTTYNNLYKISSRSLHLDKVSKPFSISYINLKTKQLTVRKVYPVYKYLW